MLTWKLNEMDRYFIGFIQFVGFQFSVYSGKREQGEIKKAPLTLRGAFIIQVLRLNAIIA